MFTRAKLSSKKLKTLFCSCPFSSHDDLKILQGGRKVRRLSGVYGHGLFGLGGSGDLDDDCDDNDDGDDGDDGYSDNRGRERLKKMFGFPGKSGFGYPMRNRHDPQYVLRLSIPGTSELISIIFESNDHDTKKGFDAVYRVTQGEYSYTQILWFRFITFIPSVSVNFFLPYSDQLLRFPQYMEKSIVKKK